MEEVIKRLLTVKSIVTLVLTGVFSYITITGQMSTEFLTIYTTVIAFYFGTQYEKGRELYDRTIDDSQEQH